MVESLTVYEIFSIKVLCDLEYLIWLGVVQDH